MYKCRTYNIDIVLTLSNVPNSVAYIYPQIFKEITTRPVTCQAMCYSSIVGYTMSTIHDITDLVCISALPVTCTAHECILPKPVTSHVERTRKPGPSGCGLGSGTRRTEQESDTKQCEYFLYLLVVVTL